ncbi:cytochrome P450 [Mycena vulgaris]|nr:cytochrome P450 [Mycena vulgaris]
MSRQAAAKEGFTFSDGTHIPYGGFLNVPTHAVNSDPAFYEHADKFEGFRFSLIESEGPTFFNRQIVSTAQDHLVFGHGHHACSGRFFAATELKAMLAHILINYDVRAETAGVKSQDEFFSFMRSRIRGARFIFGRGSIDVW